MYTDRLYEYLLFVRFGGFFLIFVVYRTLFTLIINNITHLTAILFATTRVSRYQKGKTSLNLLEQEIVSGSDISWDICKTAPRPDRYHTSTPPLSFLQARCPSCHTTNSVKALKAFLCGHWIGVYRGHIFRGQWSWYWSWNRLPRYRNRPIFM